MDGGESVCGGRLAPRAAGEEGKKRDGQAAREQRGGKRLKVKDVSREREREIKSRKRQGMRRMRYLIG